VASRAFTAVSAACLVVAPAVLAVPCAPRAVLDAAVRVRRAEDFVAAELRLAAFRFPVAAARLAAAWRCVRVWVAIDISSPRVRRRFD
jgi:hypothetical protein